MAIARYFAMTAAEIRGNDQLPPGIAWMACHFSPYGTGLSNLPKALPAGSLLILNDRTPICGHDAVRIARQLEERVEALNCRGLLLDLQRPGEPETTALVRHLADTLSCPMAVSDLYAQGLDCPAFLPPVPQDVPLKAYLAPWQGREIWLEMALDGAVLTLTEESAATAPLSPSEHPEGGHREVALHCHYQIELSEADVKFTLWRAEEDLEKLLEEAEGFGVTTAVGLYQEFYRTKAPLV